VDGVGQGGGGDGRGQARITHMSLSLSLSLSPILSTPHSLTLSARLLHPVAASL
jgi:hypothetical protein